jgi:hypothetical protein
MGAPYAPPTPCTADTFKPFINPVTYDVRDAWNPCGGKTSKEDSLCPVHRKMLNKACMHGGLIQFSSNIRVPLDAIEKGGCAFPASYIGLITTTGTLKAAVGAKVFTDLKTEKFEISNMSQMSSAALKAFGTP